MLQVKNFEELPLTLTVEQFGAVTGISRSLAYTIVKEEGLALRIGEKRLVIPKERLIRYLQNTQIKTVK